MSLATQVVLFHHFRRFLEAARDNNIDVVPLKGAHLLTKVYRPGAPPRPIGDVDFLVRPSDWKETLGLVEALGFVRVEKGNAPLVHYEAGFRLDVGGELSILFEPHTAILDPHRFPLDHEALWSRTSASTFDGVRCRRLAPEDVFVHVAFHSATHSLGNFGVALQDLEMLIRHGDVPLDLVVARARQWRAIRATWLFLDILSRRCPDLTLGDGSRALAPPPLHRAVLRKLGTVALTDAYAPTPHRARAALVWPWVLDGPVELARAAGNHPVVRGGVHELFRR